MNDLILSELEKLEANFGEWSRHLVLGGGAALTVYDRCMAKASARAIGTTNLDFLIPRQPDIPGGSVPLSKILTDQGFLPRTRDIGKPPVEYYVKKIQETEIEVKFLTDDRTRTKADSTPIAEAQVVAQPLSYLEMSLESVMTAQLPRGAEIRIVRPEAWAFHKGLTFNRGKSGSALAVRDLYGIWFVLTLLGDFSGTAWNGLKSLQAKQPKAWRDSFRSNMRAWVNRATQKDWGLLMAQDPERRLTQASFQGLVDRLTKS